MGDDIRTEVRPRPGVLRLLHAVLALLAIILAVEAWLGAWRYFAEIALQVLLYLGVFMPGARSPRVTMRGDAFSYRALEGSFSFSAADVVGVRRDYVFRAPDSQPFELKVQLRDERRPRVVRLARFSQRDVALIVSFFSRSPAEPETT